MVHLSNGHCRLLPNESCIQGESKKVFPKCSSVSLPDSGANVTYVENALTQGEYDFLIDYSTRRGDCKRSLVSGPGEEDVVDPARTSTTCFLGKGEEASVLSCIEDKLSGIAGSTTQNLEFLQVTKYKGPSKKEKKGQLYNPHFDWFEEKDIEREGGSQREKTLFVYLQDLAGRECGGATVFPKLFSEGGETLRFYPKAGDALLWDNLLDNGDGNTQTLHGGGEVTCPRQEKIGLNAWFRNKALRTQ